MLASVIRATHIDLNCKPCNARMLFIVYRDVCNNSRFIGEMTKAVPNSSHSIISKIWKAFNHLECSFNHPSIQVIHSIGNNISFNKRIIIFVLKTKTNCMLFFFSWCTEQISNTKIKMISQYAKRKWIAHKLNMNEKLQSMSNMGKISNRIPCQYEIRMCVFMENTANDKYRSAEVTAQIGNIVYLFRLACCFVWQDIWTWLQPRRFTHTRARTPHSCYSQIYIQEHLLCIRGIYEYNI